MFKTPLPSTGLDISSTNLSTLITLIGNLKLNAADAETLASTVLLRSCAEAFIGSSGLQPTYPTVALCPLGPEFEDHSPTKSVHLLSRPCIHYKSLYTPHPTPPVVHSLRTNSAQRLLFMNHLRSNCCRTCVTLLPD
ncbi:hypothetical protein BKA82DRAFT_4353473 [Pisolithus tinctorius]|nr:hypothetical protein BKA82DRAFT_4353473 [Pisolithus tinctorius]